MKKLLFLTIFIFSTKNVIKANKITFGKPDFYKISNNPQTSRSFKNKAFFKPEDLSSSNQSHFENFYPLQSQVKLQLKKVIEKLTDPVSDSDERKASASFLDLILDVFKGAIPEKINDLKNNIKLLINAFEELKNQADFFGTMLEDKGDRLSIEKELVRENITIAAHLVLINSDILSLEENFIYFLQSTIKLYPSQKVKDYYLGKGINNFLNEFLKNLNLIRKASLTEKPQALKMVPKYINLCVYNFLNFLDFLRKRRLLNEIKFSFFITYLADSLVFWTLVSSEKGELKKDLIGGFDASEFEMVKSIVNIVSKDSIILNLSQDNFQTQKVSDKESIIKKAIKAIEQGLKSDPKSEKRFFIESIQMTLNILKKSEISQWPYSAKESLKDLLIDTFGSEIKHEDSIFDRGTSNREIQMWAKKVYELALSEKHSYLFTEDEFGILSERIYNLNSLNLNQNYLSSTRNQSLRNRPLSQNYINSSRNQIQRSRSLNQDRSLSSQKIFY